MSDDATPFERTVINQVRGLASRLDTFEQRIAALAKPNEHGRRIEDLSQALTSIRNDIRALNARLDALVDEGLEIQQAPMQFPQRAQAATPSTPSPREVNDKGRAILEAMATKDEPVTAGYIAKCIDEYVLGVNGSLRNFLRKNGYVIEDSPKHFALTDKARAYLNAHQEAM